MREFLYKNSFFRYAASITSCGGRRVPIAAPFISFYALMLFSLIGGISSLNIISACAAMLACLLYFSGSLTSAYRNVIPNLASIMPLKGKRKCVYDFLLTLLYALIAILAVAVIIGITALIILAVTTATDGVENDGSGDNPFQYSIGVYGGIFCVTYVIILYSAGMIGGYIKDRKRRNIFYASFIVAVVAGILLTGLPYLTNGANDPDLPRFCSPFVAECYKYMKLPWLSSVMWSLIAAGMFATAIYMGWKYHKPKTY